MKDKISTSRMEFWVAVVTILGFVGNIAMQVGSIQTSIHDLKTSQQNEITLVNGLILKSTQHASSDLPLSINN